MNRSFWPVFAAGLVFAGVGCDRQPASRVENLEPSIKRDSESGAHSIPPASSPPVQKQRVEGHYEGASLNAWTAARAAGSDVENAVDTANELMTEKAAAYAESDPGAGLAWAKALATPRQREAALESLAWACATTHLGVSVAALEQLPTGNAKSRLVVHVVGQWAAGNPDDAQAWAENRSDPAERTEALAAFAVAIAEEFPARAATLVAETMQAGAAQNRAVVAVLQRWIQTDRNAAEQWVAQFPATPLKAAALAVITGNIPPDPPPVETKSPTKDSQAR